MGLQGARVLSVSSKGELAVLLRKSEAVVGDTLARVPIGGGTPREILEDVFDADWAPDGDDMAVLRLSKNGNRELQYPIGTTLVEGNSISGIRVSPKGDLVAFGDGGKVYTVDRKGKRSAISGELSVGSFAWSPRGDGLMMIGSRSDGEQALYAVSLSGRERVLTNLAHGMSLYDIARDGRLLVEHFHGVGGIACRRAGEARDRELGLHEPGLLDISEDGQLILFFDDAVPDELLLRKTDGTPAIHLGKGEGQGLSADGRWVVVIRNGELVLIPTGPGRERDFDRRRRTSSGNASSERKGVCGTRQGQRRLDAQAIPGRAGRRQGQTRPR